MLGDWINTIFQSIMLWLDSVIYWFAAQCYQLFMKLSVTQIFDENFFNNFATRIYSILGVFMLFYLAYALLNALVDPDKLAKGDKSVSKIAQNLVVSLVILGLLPSIFSYAYRLQNYILSSNVIGSLIFGTPTIDPTVESDDSLIRYGDAISFTVLNTFLNSDDYNVRLGNDYTWYDVKYEILHDGDYSKLPGLSDPIVNETTVLSGEHAGESHSVDYKVGISSLAGIYLCYIMLSFTLDLGVRVVKLAFCQLIAPIPVVMRAVPGKNGTFDKWLKLTLSVYFEIFVRVAFMYIAVYFINGLTTSNVFDNFFSGGIQGMLALVIIILGILTFAKQAPKMISDMLGLDTGNMKLGIGEKLKAGGFFTGGAMIGAGATGLVRNSIHGLNGIKNNWANTRGFKNKAKLLAGDLVGTAGSTIAGTTSGMFNAFKAGKDAKGFGDMVKAAGTGAQKSTENRINRASYKAAHGNTIRGAMYGHLQDTAFNVKEWAGIEPPTEALQKKVSIYDKGMNFKKQLEDIAKRKSEEAKLYDEQIDALNASVIKPEDYRGPNGQINQNDYYKAIEERAIQIKDLKSKKDIAIAKKVVDMVNHLDKNTDVQAVIKEFETFKRQNAGMPGISELKDIQNMNWDTSWDNDASKMKKELSYLVNNTNMRDQKNAASVELNERIIKEQEKKK